MTWTKKRFWKTTEPARAGDAWTVHLDRRGVRTPAGTALTVPTEALAKALAEEWDAQVETIDPASMPLTRLADTALDRIGDKHGEVVEALASYAATDLLCYRVDMPRQLAERQHAAWQPLLDWADEAYGAHLAVTDGITAVEQPAETILALTAAVSAYDDWHLAALSSVVQGCGSLVLGLALAAGKIGGEEAFELSRLEEAHNVDRWGDDTEAAARREALRADIVAAGRFLEMLEK